MSGAENDEEEEDILGDELRDWDPVPPPPAAPAPALENETSLDVLMEKLTEFQDPSKLSAARLNEEIQKFEKAWTVIPQDVVFDEIERFDGTVIPRVDYNARITIQTSKAPYKYLYWAKWASLSDSDGSHEYYPDGYGKVEYTINNSPKRVGYVHYRNGKLEVSTLEFDTENREFHQLINYSSSHARIKPFSGGLTEYVWAANGVGLEEAFHMFRNGSFHGDKVQENDDGVVAAFEPDGLFFLGWKKSDVPGKIDVKDGMWYRAVPEEMIYTLLDRMFGRTPKVELYKTLERKFEAWYEPPRKPKPPGLGPMFRAPIEDSSISSESDDEDTASETSPTTSDGPVKTETPLEKELRRAIDFGKSKAKKFKIISNGTTFEVRAVAVSIDATLARQITKPMTILPAPEGTAGRPGYSPHLMEVELANMNEIFANPGGRKYETELTIAMGTRKIPGKIKIWQSVPETVVVENKEITIVKYYIPFGVVKFKSATEVFLARVENGIILATSSPTFRGLVNWRDYTLAASVATDEDAAALWAEGVYRTSMLEAGAQLSMLSKGKGKRAKKESSSDVMKARRRDLLASQERRQLQKLEKPRYVKGPPRQPALWRGFRDKDRAMLEADYGEDE